MVDPTVEIIVQNEETRELMRQLLEDLYLKAVVDVLSAS
jgi:hypothetical protein